MRVKLLKAACVTAHLIFDFFFLFMLHFALNGRTTSPPSDKSTYFLAAKVFTHVGNCELCLVIPDIDMLPVLCFWLRRRPAEIRGAGPPLPHLQGNAVNQDAG